MTRRAERRAGAAGEARACAPLAFAAWLLLSVGCAALAGCTGPGLDPPSHSGAPPRADGGARDAGQMPQQPRAGSGGGASGQGGRSGGTAGARAGAGGAAGPDDDGGVPPLDGGLADGALPDSGPADASTDGGDAGSTP